MKFELVNVDNLPESLKPFHSEANGAHVFDVEGNVPDDAKDWLLSALAEANGKINITTRTVRGERDTALKEVQRYREIGKVEELKDVLAEYRALGTVEELTERQDELASLRTAQKGDDEKSKELLALKKQLRDTTREYDGYKKNVEPKLSEFDGLLAIKRDTENAAALDKVIESLPVGYDKGKFRQYAKLTELHKQLERDELGELKPLKGLPVEEFLIQLGDLNGYKVSSTNGGAKPPQVPFAKAAEQQKNSDAPIRARRPIDAIAAAVAEAPVSDMKANQ